jgi:uncharacterized protein (UPF0264 family)
MTRMLASVASLAEARLVAGLGVDLVDLKQPAAGALGALPVDEVARIVLSLAGRWPISATVGDLPMVPEVVAKAVASMAATGVDYVKIGFFPGGDWVGVVEDLRPLVQAGTRLVAVLFGDCAPELHWVAALAGAGFTGAMLDTADKAKGSLREVCEPEFLRDFVAEARGRGLLCGLAGSLRAGDIPSLLALQPDYLGFRGALCGGNRTGAVDSELTQRIQGLVRGGG